MIPWPGDEMHEAPPGCWADQDGDECGAPATEASGLCNSHDEAISLRILAP